MPKTKRATSKRVNSNTRHKIERKKREHKRDLKKAAKAMKAAGLGQKRSKKSRETAKLALKISNNHPDKETILTKILQAREQAKVVRAEKRQQKRSGVEPAAENEEEVQQVPRASNKKALLFIPHAKSNNFAFQFNKALDEIVFPIPEEGADSTTVNAELPACAFVVTVDARCAVQSAPWSLLDAVVDRAQQYTEYAKKSSTEGKRAFILFALTKCDLVSATTISTQFALLAHAICKRYFPEKAHVEAPTPSRKGSKSAHAAPAAASLLELPGLVISFAPTSTQFDRCQKHLFRMLRRFATVYCKTAGAQHPTHNMNDKVCAFVIGLPGTGRRTLTKSILSTGTDTAVSVVPLRSAQIQLIKRKKNAEDEEATEVSTRFVLPSAKSLTFVQFAEDATLRKQSSASITSGDIVFQPVAAIDRLETPEAVAILLAQGTADPVALAQAFCQPVFSQGEQDSIVRFLMGIGNTVRREGGFHVSPLFVAGAGTAGQISSTSLTASTSFNSRQQSNQFALIDSTYSNARPSKLVRISDLSSKGGRGKNNKGVQKIDRRNALRIGARTFLREFANGKNVPWAVLRAKDEVLSPEIVAKDSLVFNLALFAGHNEDHPFASAAEYMKAFMDHITSLMKDVLILLPNGVVEFSASAIVPVLHNVDVVEEAASEDAASDDDAEEEGQDEEDDDEEDGEDDDEEDEQDDEEEDDDNEESE